MSRLSPRISRMLAFAAARLTNTLLGALLLALPFAGGCGCGKDERARATGTSSEALIGVNGITYNGINLNGTKYNGITLNGFTLNGITLDGITLNGFTLNGVSLEGTELHGAHPTLGAMHGNDFIDASMTGLLASGDELTLRIDAIEQINGISFYAVSYDNGDSWQNLCGEDTGGTPVGAIPLSGTWNEQTGDHNGASSLITFACRGAALAKCVEWGYAPWRSVEECTPEGTCQMVSLAPVHQACTRMVRADYCGDGTSHTVNGTPINIWDNFGIQVEDPTSWALEAEWTAQGAICVTHSRIEDDAILYIQTECSERWYAGNLDCGGPSSTFFTANGFSSPPEERVFLRNESQ